MLTRGTPTLGLMTEPRAGLTTDPRPTRVHAALAGSVLTMVSRFSGLAWWVQVVLVYAASRVVSFAILAAAALQQGSNPWLGAQPDYWHFVQIWDSEWYGRIVEGGYPSVLPRSATGELQQNAWAFYPVYPLLVRALGALPGLPWQAWAQIVALVAGFAAAVVLYRLFRHRADHGDALWGVAFVALFPVSAILQIPYAESLGLLFLAWALLWIVERRYLAAMPAVALAALTRPVGVPLALMLGGLFVVRLMQTVRQRPSERATAAELARLAALTAVGVASAAAWPLIAWAVTGVPDAYTATETVWRGGPLVPFLPWFDTGQYLFGPVLGAIAPMVLVALAALYFTSGHVRRIGLEMLLWCVAYVAYLLAVLHPQTSTFRMMLPLFPLALASATLSRSRAYRWATVVLFVLLQIVWVVWLWVWAQLPGGGDWPP
ncbi:membrane protein [Sinomonas cellulolyticus]|nr:membrane protein [Sinomonas sp. KCTC 49339]